MQLVCSNFLKFSSNQEVIPYNMVGNFIPPEWRYLTDPTGRSLSKTSRQLLSLIVSCFESQAATDKLQESYYFFEQQLGVCQRRVRQCFVELQRAGFITLELLTIIKHHIKCRNMLSIKLLKDFKNLQAANDHSNTKNFLHTEKNFSREAEESFRLERKNFPPHNIIDNNISILESRSNFVNCCEDFSKNSSNNDSPQEPKTQPKQQEYLDDDDQEPPQTPPSNWLSKVATKAKDFCGLKKKLAEFHPLSDEDEKQLQMQSGKEFNLNFINLLLLRLAKRYPDHSFPNKKAVLNYMTKALAYEMRESGKVNNEGFRFRQDSDITARDEYLKGVEYSKATGKTSQFRRKIAAIFEPGLAYSLLTGCSFVEPQGDCYELKLIRDITISDHVKNALLQEAKGVYGKDLERLEVTPLKVFASQNSKFNEIVADDYHHLQGLDGESVWFKVRKCLVEACGATIDKAWFSKLEVVKEDQISKKLVLKPESSFFGSWITQNYQSALENAFIAQGFSFEMTKF